MPIEEFIVTNVQWLLPTWFLRLLVRFYLRYSGGPAMRGGDVVIKQIHVDSEVEIVAQRLRPMCLPARPASARDQAQGGVQPRLASAPSMYFPRRSTGMRGARSL